MEEKKIAAENPSSEEKKAIGDEDILWEGNPIPVRPLNDFNRKSMIIRFIITAAVLIVFMALYLSSCSIRENRPNLFIIIFVLGIGVYTAVRPMLDIGRLNSKVRYYVTENTVTVYTGETFVLPRKNLRLLKVPSEHGGAHYLFGKCTENKPKRYIDYALFPEKEENRPLGLCFYNLADSPELDALLGL